MQADTPEEITTYYKASTNQLHSITKNHSYNTSHSNSKYNQKNYHQAVSTVSQHTSYSVQEHSQNLSEISSKQIKCFLSSAQVRLAIVSSLKSNQSFKISSLTSLKLLIKIYLQKLKFFIFKNVPTRANFKNKRTIRVG